VTEQTVIHLGQQAIQTTLIAAAPMLLSGLVVGLVVGVLQAVTQIHEMTLTFVPKILCIGLALYVFVRWILTVLVNYTEGIFTNLPMGPLG